MLLVAIALSVWPPAVPPNVPHARPASQIMPPPGDLAAPGVPSAGRNRAITGDTIVFGGEMFRLDGLICPDPATEAGRQAKALMNTLLRGPYVECAVIRSDGSPPVGACRRDGRRVADGTDFATAMRESGLCE